MQQQKKTTLKRNSRPKLLPRLQGGRKRSGGARTKQGGVKCKQKWQNKHGVNASLTENENGGIAQEEEAGIMTETETGTGIETGTGVVNETTAEKGIEEVGVGQESVAAEEEAEDMANVIAEAEVEAGTETGTGTGIETEIETETETGTGTGVPTKTKAGKGKGREVPATTEIAGTNFYYPLILITP